MQRSSNLICVQRDTRTREEISPVFTPDKPLQRCAFSRVKWTREYAWNSGFMRSRRCGKNWGVFVENGTREESTGRGSSSCSIVPSGKWLYSMELFARAGGRPIFTLREINARFTRCCSSRIYVFVGQLFRYSIDEIVSTHHFVPKIWRGIHLGMENNNR